MHTVGMYCHKKVMNTWLCHFLKQMKDSQYTLHIFTWPALWTQCCVVLLGVNQLSNELWMHSEMPLFPSGRKIMWLCKATQESCATPTEAFMVSFSSPSRQILDSTVWVLPLRGGTIIAKQGAATEPVSQSPRTLSPLIYAFLLRFYGWAPPGQIPLLHPLQFIFH